MINLKQISKFLNYCGIDDPERHFGLISHETLTGYINVNAALLDAVSSTDDGIVASTALAYIKNMGDIDTSSVTQESLRMVVEKLVRNALDRECVLNYIVLYLYTYDDNVLEILMTFTDLSFHDAVLLLLAADIIPQRKRNEYVDLAVYHIEYGLLHNLYTVEELPDSLAVLYCHDDYISESKLLKKLLKLFSIIPSANNYLTRIGLSLRDLLYVSLCLATHSSFSTVKDRTRLVAKYFAACIVSEDILPLYIKELFGDMLVQSNYVVLNRFMSEGAICSNFDNFKWLVENEVSCDLLDFPLFDVHHYIWAKYLLHKVPEAFARMLLVQIDGTPAAVVKSVMTTIPAMWMYLQSVQPYTMINLCKALSKHNIFTMAEMILHISEEHLLYMAEMEPKFLMENIEVIFARALSAKARSKLLSLCCTQRWENVPIGVLKCYEEHIFSRICTAGDVLPNEIPYYIANRFLSFLVRFNCCIADNTISDMHVNVGSKRKYGRSVLSLLKATNQVAPDSVYKLAYTEKEYMVFRRDSLCKSRAKACEELRAVPNAAMLSRWITNNSSADYAYDYVLAKIHALFSINTSTRDIAVFIGDCYDSLYSLHIDPDDLLDALRQRKGAVC